MKTSKSTLKKTVCIAVCVICAICVLTACGSNGTSTSAYSGDSAKNEAYYGDYDEGAGLSYEYAEAEEVGYETNVSTTSSTDGKENAKIIYTASVLMETKEFDTAMSDIEALANKYDAYFESKDVSTYSSSYRVAYMTVRVPVENYSRFVEESRGVAVVTSISEYAEDVSETYYDIEARLETAKTKLKRLQELLAQAEDMSDIITIEESIADTEYQIDSLQGNLNNYDSRIEYATVTIDLNEVYEITDTEKAETFGEKLAKAFTDGLEGFGEFLEEVAVFLASAWLWLVIFIIAPLVVLIFVLKSVKKRKNKDK